MEIDTASQSIEAMAEILKMATEQSTNLAEKLIKMNAQTLIDLVKDETVGRAIGILV